jgi:iron(III) transport system ATP-binding protein
MTALTVDGVVAEHGAMTVLHGVGLEVPAGTTTAILGPSGCGKTTLLRVIAGFHRPSAGRVVVGDREVTGPEVLLAPEHRGLGYVAQEGALFPHLSVGDNITFGLRRGEGKVGRLTELLDVVGLPREVATRRPDQLSGGQQQRVALARALARRPRVVLLDEPFSSLDAGLRTSTRRAVADALAAEGVTVLMVTHDQDEALSFADQVVVMDAGRILQAGAPREVYAAPSDRVTAGFLGDVVTLVGRGEGALVECALGRLPTVAPAHGTVEVALRPEQVVLSDADGVGPAGATDAAGARGRVRHRDYFGHDALVHVVLDDGSDISARLGAGGTIPSVGDRVAVQVLGRVLTYPL